ncbi:MAG: peptide/nickel transport system permease protein [Micromonosporaceae bacterium]|nr:peptide/nickel transport system permease protein [Micromonosporaceae bacterium]
MVRYVLRRLAVTAALLAVLSFVVFVGVDILPGDPVTARLGTNATPAQIADARHRAGLDRPVLDRYAEWLSGLARGDFGASLITGRPVRDMLADRAANSVLLAGLTVLLVVPLSLGLGLLAGLRRDGRLDRAVTISALLLVALPEYIVASVLALVLAVGLGWLPAISLVPAGDSPLSHPAVLVLPVLSLLLLSLAYAVRVIRSGTAAAMQAPHVEAARLNGMGGWRLIRRAVLPAVLPGAIQIWCVLAVALVGSAVLVERVYGYPGLGETVVFAVQSGDLLVAQALAMLLGAAMLLALLVADLGVLLLTPRLRTGMR